MVWGIGMNALKRTRSLPSRFSDLGGPHQLRGAGAPLFFLSGNGQIPATSKHDQITEGRNPKKNLTAPTPQIPRNPKHSLSVVGF